MGKRTTTTRAGEKIRVSITISPDLHRELEREAARRRKRTGENVTRSGVYEEMLRIGLGGMPIGK